MVAGGKQAFGERLVNLFLTHPKVIVVGADHVTSNQFHGVRTALRGKAIVCMGKNTMMRRVLRKNMEKFPQVEAILPYLEGNVGLIFTKEDPVDIRTIMTEKRVEAPARAGSIAPVDVFIPPMNTGLEPTQTSFFQAVGIPTKIARGAIEIISEVHLVKKGDKVTASQAALLQKLNIMPFAYALELLSVFDAGVVYGAEVLDLDDDVLGQHFQEAANAIAGLSLAIHHPTVASVPHLLISGYLNLIHISLATDYTIDGAKEIREYLADPSKFAVAAAPVAATSAAPAAAAAAPEPEEESDDDMGLGLFD